MSSPVERERLAAFYWDILDVALVDETATRDGRLVLSVEADRWPVVRGRLVAAGATYETREGPSLVFIDPAGIEVTIVEAGSRIPRDTA